MLHTITRNPQHGVYRRLIDWAIRECPSVLLVERDNPTLSDHGRDVLDKLAPFLLRQERSSQWPGTQLLSGEATVYRYRTSDFLGAILKRSATSLFDWRQPWLPEDLCFLAPDGNAILTTISHEEDAFVDLDDTGVAALRETTPGLDFTPD